MVTRSDGGQHASDNLESEVLFVAEPVRAALEHADLLRCGPGSPSIGTGLSLSGTFAG